MKTWTDHQETRTLAEVKAAALAELAALEAAGENVAELKKWIETN